MTPNVDNSKVNCTFPTAQPDRRPWLLLLSAVILLLDRLTKYWVVRHIPEGDAIVVIRHVFRITTMTKMGEREVPRVRPFVKVASNLALSAIHSGPVEGSHGYGVFRM